MLKFLALLLVVSSVAAVAQFGRQDPEDPFASFPPIPPLTMYEEVLKFRAEVERSITIARPRLSQAKTVVDLVDTLVSKWDYYGTYMDRAHGHFPNMSRGRPYWLITTDEAADTLTDRLLPVVEAYAGANPEKTGTVRAEWELAIQEIGVPRSRLFGFQFVELARRGAEARGRLEADHPTDRTDVHDAYIRFLWDLLQFYRQLHATWYDRYSMNVAGEDWIVHRMKGRCEEPNWQVHMSFTAIGVDTTDTDPMNDKFMHRLVLVDPDCPDTVDFVVPLRHYRRMEKELNERSEEERQQIYERYRQEAIRRAQGERGTGR